MENKIIDLLLSYTYFLDNDYKSLISVGYNINNLLPSIVLKKATSIKEIEYSVFMNIYKFREDVTKYFNDIDATSSTNISKEFTLTTSKNEKEITIRDCISKITLKQKEWNRLYNLLPFIVSVTNYQHKSAYLVKDYYESYLSQCLEKQVLKLDQHPIVPYEIDTITINYSRLFHEIPILCANKLFDDYLNNIIQTSINSVIN